MISELPLPSTGLIVESVLVKGSQTKGRLQDRIYFFFLANFGQERRLLSSGTKALKEAEGAEGDLSRLHVREEERLWAAKSARAKALPAATCSPLVTFLASL